MAHGWDAEDRVINIPEDPEVPVKVIWQHGS